MIKINPVIHVNDFISSTVAIFWYSYLSQKKKIIGKECEMTII